MNIGVFYTLQRAFDQQLQLIQIATELMLQLLVFKQLNPQTQTGDGRAQIMGNSTEQLAALSQVATDARTHGIERPCDFHHLTATADFDGFNLFLTQRQIPRSPRQPLERAALPVHQQTDGKQQKNTAQRNEPQLHGRQPFFFQAGVGLWQQ